MVHGKQYGGCEGADVCGGDDGVQMGHFLEVYRDDEYLGRVQVISVKPDRSVGRVIREFKRGDIQPGDRVATRLKA